MISDSANKVFQYVLVYKLDRFSRNRYDSAVYKKKLKDNGVKAIVYENKIDVTFYPRNDSGVKANGQ